MMYELCFLIAGALLVSGIYAFLTIKKKPDNIYVQAVFYDPYDTDQPLQGIREIAALGYTEKELEEDWK